MSEMHETLANYADDAELKVIELHDTNIIISISLPSRGGDTWLIRSNNVVHVDMSPRLTLGRIEFGGLSLLPASYEDSRNIYSGGEANKYRVLRFIDIDDKNGYLVLCGYEIIEIRGAG